MLEEVQVAQLLGLGVVNRVFPRDLWMGKTSTSREIDINREPSLARVEIDSLHKPWSLDAKGCLEQFVCHHGYCPPISRPARRSSWSLTNAGAPHQVNPHPRSGLWICGRRQRAPPTTPQERHNRKTGYRRIPKPIQNSKEAKLSTVTGRPHYCAPQGSSVGGAELGHACAAVAATRPSRSCPEPDRGHH
jgi:hypothetical protein